jgi:hypothetical protein
MSVDDPADRVDKAVDEMWKNKNHFPTLSPTTLPTLRPQGYFDYNNKYFFILF